MGRGFKAARGGGGRGRGRGRGDDEEDYRPPVGEPGSSASPWSIEHRESDVPSGAEL